MFGYSIAQTAQSTASAAVEASKLSLEMLVQSIDSAWSATVEAADWLESHVRPLLTRAAILGGDVVAALTSKRAIALYRKLGNDGLALLSFLYDVCLLVYVLGKLARERMDSYVEACQVPVEVVPVAAIALTVADPWEMEVAVEEVPLPNLVPDMPVKLLAAAVDESMGNVEVSTKKPSRDELRKACQSAGIQWRDAHGKNKHLTVAEMQAALAKVAAVA